MYLIKLIAITLLLAITSITNFQVNSSPIPDSLNTKLDDRFSTVMVGDYPTSRGTDMYKYALNDIQNSMGFQNQEVYLNFEICWQRNLKNKPNGFYQTRRFCTPEATMESVAKDPIFDNIFKSDYKTLFITTGGAMDYDSTTKAVNTHQLTNPVSQNRFDILYNDYYNLVKHLRNTYSMDKKIVLQSTNEMDWQIGENNQLTDGKSQTALAHQNVIKYWGTIQSAINNAKRDTNSNLKVYQGCEFTLGYKAMTSGINSIVNSVMPYVDCDLWGYSAYDTLTHAPNQLEMVLKYIKEKARDYGDFQGNNLYISEIGMPDVAFLKQRDSNTAKIQTFIDTALLQNVPYINFWSGYEQCTESVPTLATCEGYGFRKPNGQLGEVYKTVFPKYTQTPVNHSDSAEFVSMEVPETVEKNSTFQVKVKYKNTGKQAWTRQSMHRLGFYDTNQNIWNIQRTELTPEEFIFPNEIKEFTFQVKALPTTGSYPFQVDMLKENQFWFNKPSTIKPIQVTAPTNQNKFLHISNCYKSDNSILSLILKNANPNYTNLCPGDRFDIEHSTSELNNYNYLNIASCFSLSTRNGVIRAVTSMEAIQNVCNEPSRPALEGVLTIYLKQPGPINLYNSACVARSNKTNNYSDNIARLSVGSQSSKNMCLGDTNRKSVSNQTILVIE